MLILLVAVVDSLIELLVEIADRHLRNVGILAVLRCMVNKMDCPTNICNVFRLVTHQNAAISVAMDMAPTQLLLKDTPIVVFGRASAVAGEF